MNLQTIDVDQHLFVRANMLGVDAVWLPGL
jgi:hypothetical protein